MSRSVLSVMDDGTTFDTVVMAVFNSKFLYEWQRLRKVRIVDHKRKDKNLELFVADVKDLVWDRLPGSAFALDLPDDPADYRPGGAA